MDDFDIEMGDAADVPMEEPQVADIVLGDDLQEDGEIEEAINGVPTDDAARKVVWNKVHIRGLDQLDQNQLKSYVSAHVGGRGADRIEWIDDTSANLVYSTDSAAQDTLLALAAVEIADATALPPSEILPAKPFAEKPEAQLQVRFAVESDRKEKGAAQKSRFYLFHPEWDPETEEGRRRREGRERRYRDRDRDRDDRGGYRRNGRSRYDDRYEEEPEPFDVNLYDDDAGAVARRVTPQRGGRRRDSRSPSNRSQDDRHRSTNREKELFPNRRPRDPLHSERGRYSRDRSASPARDDRDAMEDDLAKDREAVRSNREKARSIRECIYKGDTNNGSRGVKELFPNKASKELFPSKIAAEGRKAQMDQVPEDILAGMSSLSYDGAADLNPFPFSYVPSKVSPIGVIARRKWVQNSIRSNKKITINFADRVTETSNNSMSIRGTARQRGGQMSIKGTATSVKELFPNKFNNNSSSGGSGAANSNKELFADKLEGRGRRRQKAEDLFY